jgi:putative endonuclease
MEGRRSGGLPRLDTMATVYILFSKQLDRYYIGHTTEPLEERLRKHLSNHTHWTSRAKDWTIVHREVLLDKSTAYKRELQVKGWKNRTRIEALCATNQW